MHKCLDNLGANALNGRMWQEIIKTLGQKGLTDAEIARRVGTNQTTITRLKNGRIADTSYRTGVALMQLAEAEDKQAA